MTEVSENITGEMDHVHDLDQFPESEMYRYPTWTIVILIVSYLIVFLMGIVGNASVVLVILKHPQISKTATNLYVANLAVADFLVITVCLLPNLMSNIYVPWILGWFLCKTVPYVQGVSVCASVYSLVAISVDRFLTIWFPLRCQAEKFHTQVVIVGIWIFACLLMLPWAFFFNITRSYPEHPEIEFCIEMWPSNLNPNIYFIVANLLICYLLPLSLISICYFFIWLRVWRRFAPSDSESFTSAQLSHMDLIHQRAKVSVLKMILVVIFAFMICWLPLYSIFVRIKLGGPLSPLEEEIITLVKPIAQWLGSCSSCINPILYGFLNAKFRCIFLTMLRRIKTPRGQQQLTIDFKKPIVIKQSIVRASL